MVMNRAIRLTGCSSCRLSLLRAFTSAAAPSIRIQPSSTTVPRPVPASKGRYSSHIVQDNGQEHDRSVYAVELNEEASEDTIGNVNEQSAQVSAVPWYLQVDTPQRAPQPLSDRQRIPDLPDSPPPILEPLLRQTSVDLGLDDLTLLDLRKLDPPPALGANLLMIIGTARSEKHLHVSADRLCRWLRSEYKLRPDADGLLGRNELKLKLRRKSRRAKMMGNVGDDTADDGVRTGWVCVDVGAVEGPETAADETPASHDFIGFGRRTDGVRIVVQMLTEEKRSEIDLEKLWGGILRRGGQTEPESLEGEIDESMKSTPLPKATRRLAIRPSPIIDQSRGFRPST